MSEGKHTPGDWYVYVGEEREAIAVQKFVPGDSGGTVAKAICRMPVPQVWGAKNQRNTQDEINANARLIAAAPVLLAACRGALAALKGREHDQFLRDAIAKATGATQ